MNNNLRMPNGQSGHHNNHHPHHQRSQTSHLGAQHTSGQHQRHHTSQQLGQIGGAVVRRPIAPNTSRPNPQQQQQQAPQPQPRLHNSQQMPQRTAPNRTNHAPQPAQRTSQSNAPQTQTPQPQQQQQQPPLPNVLPKGWKREEQVRTKGITSGLVDIVYSPQSISSELTKPDMVGKKYRTKLELQRLIGHKYDMALLDFKTGKISQVIWRKQRRLKQIAANPTNFIQAAKYDSYLNLPIRQTASVFKQPVFYVTNNHKNEPNPNTANPPNKNNDKPKPSQVCFFLEFKTENFLRIFFFNFWVKVVLGVAFE